MYPNPTSDYVSLKIEKEGVDLEGYSYSIFNVNGERLLHGEVRDYETKIPMKDLGSATYFVTTFFGDSEVKTFRVIKN